MATQDGDFGQIILGVRFDFQIVCSPSMLRSNAIVC